MQVKNKIKEIKFFPILFTIIWYTNIVALILLFASMFSPYVSPQKTTIFAYLGLGFPIILVINIAYLVLWTAFRKWKLALISLLILCVCWKPISTYIAFSFSPKETPVNSIKLLSYNVKAFNWKVSESNIKGNESLTYIRDSGADIVCIQEYLELKSKHNKALKIDPAIKKVLKDYPYYEITNLTDKKHGYIYGVACFSKYPIIQTKELSLGAKYNGVVMHRINVKGKIISLFNNHLESNKITSEDKALYRKLFKQEESTLAIFDDVARNIQSRLGVAYKKRSKQSDLIAEQIKIEEKETDGIIVCGDFNDTPISYTYQTIRGDLNDAFLETGKGVGITYHENNFLFRIDFILHSANIKAHNFRVGKTKASDHYPVWTHLEMPQ